MKIILSIILPRKYYGHVLSSVSCFDAFHSGFDQIRCDIPKKFSDGFMVWMNECILLLLSIFQFTRVTKETAMPIDALELMKSSARKHSCDEKTIQSSHMCYVIHSTFSGARAMRKGWLLLTTQPSRNQLPYSITIHHPRRQSLAQ